MGREGVTKKVDPQRPAYLEDHLNSTLFCDKSRKVEFKTNPSQAQIQARPRALKKVEKLNLYQCPAMLNSTLNSTLFSLKSRKVEFSTNPSQAQIQAKPRALKKVEKLNLD